MPDKNDHDPGDPGNPLALAAHAKSLLSLAETDRRAAELAFEKLGFDAQLETALALTGDELQDWLMLSRDLTELVRALPPEHLHHAVRLIGEEDALALIQAASSEQMQQLTDIEWYTEGQLDHKKVRRWLELMMALNEDECDQALQGMDVNAVAQFLRKKVKPAVDRDNLLLALHLNQRYLFTPDDLEARDDFSRTLLDFFYAVDRDLFGDLLGLLVGEEPEVIEADMYAGREDRLLKRGFPALAEAEYLLEIVNASAYGIQWPCGAGFQPATETALQAGSLHRNPFLLHALAWGRASGGVGERTEREFIKESAALANSLLLAHSKDSGNPEQKTQALLAVQVLGSIGLEAVTQSNLPKAVEHLKMMELRELFRLGWSLTREVARDAWLLAMDERIANANLERNLKWLPAGLRADVLAAEDLMSWRRIAATAESGAGEMGGSGGTGAVGEKGGAVELLTWPRLCRLRHAVDTAEEILDGKARATKEVHQVSGGSNSIPVNPEGS